MEYSTVLNIINKVDSRVELMHANTVLLKFVLNNSFDKYELDTLYSTYIERKRLLNISIKKNE
jgi:hypothetical protein